MKICESEYANYVLKAMKKNGRSALKAGVWTIPPSSELVMMTSLLKEMVNGETKTRKCDVKSNPPSRPNIGSINCWWSYTYHLNPGRGHPSLKHSDHIRGFRQKAQLLSIIFGADISNLEVNERMRGVSATLVQCPQ